MRIWSLHWWPGSSEHVLALALGFSFLALALEEESISEEAAPELAEGSSATTGRKPRAILRSLNLFLASRYDGMSRT